MKGMLVNLMQTVDTSQARKSTLEIIDEIINENTDVKMSIVKRKNKINASILLEREIEIKKDNHSVRVSITKIESTEQYDALKKYASTF